MIDNEKFLYLLAFLGVGLSAIKHFLEANVLVSVVALVGNIITLIAVICILRIRMNSKNK